MSCEYPGHGPLKGEKVTGFLDTVLILFLLVGFFSVAYDRTFSFHVLLSETVLCILLSAYKCLAQQGCNIKGRVSLFIFICSLLGIVVAQYFWLTIYGPGQGAPRNMLLLNKYLFHDRGFWLCASVLVLYFGLFQPVIHQTTRAVLARIAFFFLLVVFVGGVIEFIQQDEQRLAMKLLYSVPAGFAFTLMYMVSCALVSHWLAGLEKIILLLLSLVVGGLLIYMTGTRICYLFYIAYVCINLWLISHKSLSPAFKKRALLPFAVFIALLTLYVGISRFELLWQDLHDFYLGNPTGSVSARLVLWQAGIQVFFDSPFGYTGTGRLSCIYHLLTAQYSNPQYVGDVMKVASHHLHNEIIDTFSLQGIVGGLALMFFLLSLLYISIKAAIVAKDMRFIAGFVIFYSLANSLLISDKTVICMAFVFPIYFMLKGAQQSSEKSDG